MQLFIGKDHKGGFPIRSIFRLVGKDEDALTYALGFMLALDASFRDTVIQRLVRQLVKEGNPKGKRPKAFKDNYSIHLQELSDRSLGRRDIVIKAGNRELIVEAKVGGGQPTAEQVLRYAVDDKGNPRPEVWGIVALTQTAMPEVNRAEIEEQLLVKAPSMGFAAMQWHEIMELALIHAPSSETQSGKHLFGEFLRFLREDYSMGYYDAEVSIQDVDVKNANIFDSGWMYVTRQIDKRAPLYFAPYYARRGDKSGIRFVSKVLYVENITLKDHSNQFILEMAIGALGGNSKNHGDRWEWGLQEIRNRYEQEQWKDEPVRLLFLDEPIEFRATPLTKKDSRELKVMGLMSKEIPSQVPKGFSLQFDDLLRSTTKLTD